jgi:hypothetical protein
MTVSEWIEQYRQKSDGRFETFKKAFELLHETSGENIVETGCVRLPDDWGGGMSTYLFGEYAKNFVARVWTVDISEDNMAQCKNITKEFEKYICYTIDDSHVFLTEFYEPIHLLYLDSMDCPLVDDPFYPELLQSQGHQLREVQIALPKMSPDGIILLDDNGFANGGKTKMSKEYLKKQGWKEIMGGQQSLWTK